MSIPPSYSDPEVLAQLGSLWLRAEQVIQGTLTGLHRSPFRGTSVEFSEYREYAAGDDIRRLDWRVVGRSDRYFIKQFEEESTLQCLFVLDASNSMGYGSSPLNKYQYASTIVATLAMLLLRQHDAFGLLVCQERPPTVLPPRSSPEHLRQVLETLQSTQPHGTTTLGTALQEIPSYFRSRGMVVILSDLLVDDRSWTDGVAHLRFCGHDVVVFHLLDRDELDIPFQEPILLQDMEGPAEVYAEPALLREAYRQTVMAFLARCANHCHRQHVDYLSLTTDEPVARSLNEFLHARDQRTWR